MKKRCFCPRTQGTCAKATVIDKSVGKNLQCATQVGKKMIKVDTNLEMPKWCHEFCDGISNFEPGMTLGQNSWVFIVFGTATPSIRESRGCPKNHLQKYISNDSYC